MRRSLADRPVVAVKPLLAGVGVEPRGRLIRNVHFVQPGRWSREEARRTCQCRRTSRSRFPSRWCGRRTGGSRPTRVPRGWTGRRSSEFEADLGNNLYKIWNRMCSGRYFPPPVRAVEIPKPHGGGVRMLGVPTVADRVAQTVVAMHLEERAEPRFHPDSYGYRPGKSALDAVGVCRQRCWKYDWVIDLDVQKFFDTVPWDLVVKAVRGGHRRPLGAAVCEAVAGCAAAAPRRHPSRARQGDSARVGGLADPGEPVHALRVRHLDGPEVPGLPVRALRRRCCRALREQAAGRTRACRDRQADERGGPAAPPGQDADRLLQGRQAPGRARAHLVHLPRVRLPATGGVNSKNGGHFTSFLPAISPEALKAKSADLRALRIHRRTDLTLDDLARWLNPIVAGWMNYYGRYYRSALHPLLRRINAYLRRWAGKKYRRLRTHKRFTAVVDRARSRQPGLFAHWRWVCRF